jgi:hypothetical protein
MSAKVLQFPAPRKAPAPAPEHVELGTLSITHNGEVFSLAMSGVITSRKVSEEPPAKSAKTGAPAVQG